jgi:hypothetical protein
MNLTACSIPILELRTNHQLVKKFPAFYRSRNFITVYTKADNAPYCASNESSQYTTMLILYDLGNGLFLSGSFTKTFYACLLSHASHMSSDLDLHQLSPTPAGNYIYKVLHYVIISVLLSLVHSPTPSIRTPAIYVLSLERK